MIAAVFTVHGGCVTMLVIAYQRAQVVLKKEKNIISVTANESTLSIVFSNTIGVIATYEGKGAGNIASGLSGWVEWTNTQ